MATENYDNKKVLLCERKRHTARRVASAPYAGWGGYPIQSWWGRVYPIQSWEGTPIQSWWGGGTPSSHGGEGVPHPVMVGGGYPIQSWWGYPGCPPPSRPGPSGYPWGTPLHPDLAGVPPPTIKTWPGYPPIQTWLGGVPWGTPYHPDLAGEYPGYPHHPDLAWGYPWVPPIQTWLGYSPPPSRPDQGTPHQDLAGVPPTI